MDSVSDAKPGNLGIADRRLIAGLVASIPGNTGPNDPNQCSVAGLLRGHKRWSRAVFYQLLHVPSRSVIAALDRTENRVKYLDRSPERGSSTLGPACNCRI